MSQRPLIAVLEGKLQSLEIQIEDLDAHIRKTQQTCQRMANDLRHLRDSLKELTKDGYYRIKQIDEN